jgi:hypothetical protein
MITSFLVGFALGWLIVLSVLIEKLEKRLCKATRNGKEFKDGLLDVLMKTFKMVSGDMTRVEDRVSRLERERIDKVMKLGRINKINKQKHASNKKN